MSRPDEIIPLIVWVRTTRALLMAFEYSVLQAYRMDSAVSVARTDSEWRAAYETWLAESDL